MPKIIETGVSKYNLVNVTFDRPMDLTVDNSTLIGSVKVEGPKKSYDEIKYIVNYKNSYTLEIQISEDISFLG